MTDWMPPAPSPDRLAAGHNSHIPEPDHTDWIEDAQDYAEGGYVESGAPQEDDREWCGLHGRTDDPYEPEESLGVETTIVRQQVEPMLDAPDEYVKAFGFPMVLVTYLACGHTSTEYLS